VVVTFWGTPRREVPGTWVHQCGSVSEAVAARRAGADGVILQGVEAGGHVRGSTPSLELLERARAELPDGYPILVAGGIASAADASRALEAGAGAVVAGTRFLLTAESRAHPDYKRRLVAARETVLTTLFSFGWPARHRVVANAATERGLAGGGPPALNRLVNRLSAPGARLAPERMQAVLARRQRAGGVLLGPSPPTDDGPASLLDSGPLYAGESVARIGDVPAAAEVVRALTP
jgi:NAD(P)H-dependent flavin oxidoreductase YrpB (nitropropane dioxygenase family)